MTERTLQALHAYHDGELGALSRLRVALRLVLSQELRGELDALRGLGERVRALEGDADSPDLWEDIARELPAIDARDRAEARTAGQVGPESRGARWPWLGWRVGVAAAAATAAAAVTLMVLRAPPAPGGDVVGGGTVRYLDTAGRSVIVDEWENVTVIWLTGQAPAGEVLRGIPGNPGGRA